MNYIASERIFDTVTDTKNYSVSIKTNFTVRPKDNNPKIGLVYLFISGDGKRERINLNLTIQVSDWISKNQRLKNSTKENIDLNLFLDNVLAKITAAKIIHRLSDKYLSPEGLKKELLNNMPRTRFTAFYAVKLEEEKIMMEVGSYQRYHSILLKLIEFDNDVTFIDIDLDWIEKYRKFCKLKGNENTTIASNVAGIKKFLGLALASGIKLKFDLKNITVGNTKGNRTSLSPNELKKTASYYYSPYIKENHRLILGYFLFSCMTGLRISDVQKIKRKNLIDNVVNFVAKKTKTDQSIVMNMNARKIVDFEPELFIKKYADQHINDELKSIMNILGIQKKVTFHVARHTFATSFLRAGGKVEKLQLLLAHSDIKQTMIYAHIVQLDANSEIFLLDNLFD